MIRRVAMVALIACGLVCVAPMVAPASARVQASASGTPAAAGALATPRDPVGSWISTDISLIQYRNITTGAYAPTSGTHVDLDLSRDGRYTYSALLQVTSYGCTDSLFAHETGMAVVRSDRLTLTPTTSRFSSTDTCVTKYNYAKNGSLMKRTYRWKVDRFQRGTKLCLRNESGREAPGCYWRDGSPATTDAAGSPWTRRHTGIDASLRGVSCRVGGRACLAGGESGAILASADGGATWVNATRPAFDESFKAISCPRTGDCMAVTPDSILLVRDDGQLKASQIDAWLLGIDCPNGGACVAVGNGGTTATGADGTTWTPRKQGIGNQLNSVSCPTGRQCVAVGGSWDEDGIILTSTDGGSTWARRLSDNHYEVDGISCPTTRLCVAVGHGPVDGIILTSADGGATWASHDPGLDNILQDNPLHGVSCPSVSRCVAVGDQGTILTSADGGATWDGQIAVGGDRLAPLRSVSCTSSSACVAVGDHGIILQLRA